MKTNMIRFGVNAHHNVEDFRPYSIRFKDRGSFAENVKQALKQAIKKEGEWNGWFNSPDESFYNLQKEINTKIDLLVDTQKDIVIQLGWDEEFILEKFVENPRLGLVVWANFEEKNFGFGVASRGRTASDTSPLSLNDTDRYDIKWVSLIP